MHNISYNLPPRFDLCSCCGEPNRPGDLDALGECGACAVERERTSDAAAELAAEWREGSK